MVGGFTADSHVQGIHGHSKRSVVYAADFHVQGMHGHSKWFGGLRSVSTHGYIKAIDIAVITKL